MGNDVLVICEIGLNHNGNIDIAKQLIKIAAECGANIVKFQKRCISKVYTKEELDKERESPWGTTNREQKLGLEFSGNDYEELNAYCRDISMDWTASPWDLDSVEFIKQFDLKYNKIPSARLGHKELLKAIAEQGKYTFISTGMSTMEEIENAVNIFREIECPFELMHCNSQYPLPDTEANLLCIRYLRHYFDCKVGYSDHTPGIISSLVATSLGATSIEKHITLNRTMYGSDQAASIEPNGLRKMIEYIRIIPETLGDGHKIISENEWKCRSKLYKTEDIK